MFKKISTLEERSALIKSFLENRKKLKDEIDGTQTSKNLLKEQIQDLYVNPLSKLATPGTVVDKVGNIDPLTLAFSLVLNLDPVLVLLKSLSRIVSENNLTKIFMATASMLDELEAGEYLTLLQQLQSLSPFSQTDADKIAKIKNYKNTRDYLSDVDSVRVRLTVGDIDSIQIFNKDLSDNTELNMTEVFEKYFNGVNIGSPNPLDSYEGGLAGILNSSPPEIQEVTSLFGAVGKIPQVKKLIETAYKNSVINATSVIDEIKSLVKGPKLITLPGAPTKGGPSSGAPKGFKLFENLTLIMNNGINISSDQFSLLYGDLKKIPIKDKTALFVYAYNISSDDYHEYKKQLVDIQNLDPKVVNDAQILQTILSSNPYQLDILTHITEVAKKLKISPSTKIVSLVYEMQKASKSLSTINFYETVFVSNVNINSNSKTKIEDALEQILADPTIFNQIAKLVNFDTTGRLFVQILGKANDDLILKSRGGSPPPGTDILSSFIDIASGKGSTITKTQTLWRDVIQPNHKSTDSLTALDIKNIKDLNKADSKLILHDDAFISRNRLWDSDHITIYNKANKLLYNKANASYGLLVMLLCRSVDIEKGLKWANIKVLSSDDANEYITLLQDSNFATSVKYKNKAVLSKKSKKWQILETALGAAAPELTGWGINKKKESHKAKPTMKMQSDNMLGKLHIDPAELEIFHLVGHKKGKKVIDITIDLDLYELLTKRFNPKKNYSEKSLHQYADIIKIAELPISRSKSHKKAILTGGCGAVKYYKNDDDLVKRLAVLVGSRDAGNNSKVILNEMSEILDILLAKGVIDNDYYEKMIDDYLN